MSRLEPEPGSGISVPILSDPPGAAPGIRKESCEHAMGFLLNALARSPWRCHFEIPLPAGKLHMDWRRAGSAAGYASWKWADREVAGTVLFTGHDPDDCLAIEQFARAVSPAGSPLDPAFLKRLRESARPLVGIAFGDSIPETQIPITEFSVGLIKGLCKQATFKMSRAPLGTAIPQDFPPRFLHVVIVNGAIKQMLWPQSKIFREIPNLQQAVTTFMDRFEDSFEKFDERILLRQPQGDRLFRVEWAGVRPTAGLAELTDSMQMHHTLLLLSGKDAPSDAAVLDQFVSSLPHVVRGVFDSPFREIRTCPRPLLVELVGTESAKRDSAAAPTAGALAVAFFRRLGVF